MKTPEILTWVFFASQGITDNTDLMRCHILAMEICRLGNDATIKKIKETSGYRSCICDIPDHLICDLRIQEMIDWK